MEGMLREDERMDGTLQGEETEWGGGEDEEKTEARGWDRKLTDKDAKEEGWEKGWNTEMKRENWLIRIQRGEDERLKH